MDIKKFYGLPLYIVRAYNHVNWHAIYDWHNYWNGADDRGYKCRLALLTPSGKRKAKT